MDFHIVGTIDEVELWITVGQALGVFVRSIFLCSKGNTFHLFSTQCSAAAVTPIDFNGEGDVQT